MPLSQIADFTPPAAPRGVSKPSSQNQRVVRRTMHHPAAGESRSRRTLSAVTEATPGRHVGAAAPVDRGGRGGKRGDITPTAQGQGEEVTPAGVPTRASPPRAAKDRANRLLQQRAPIPVAEVVLEHDSSIGAASAAAAGTTHSPSFSVRSDESSDSSYYSDAASRAGGRVTAARDDLVDVLFSPEDVNGDYELLRWHCWSRRGLWSETWTL